MERAGAATVIRDEDLDPDELLAAAGGLLADQARLKAMAAASAALAKPDAARRIADQVLSAVRAKRGDR
jgi:UDP-N-acetylglucosamine--N-acetylmuramyl-(pentapeptide) pyrophosphoryl-undecaprenol N-acetylglucosamine transferase